MNKWKMLRRARTFAVRHQEPMCGSRRFRAVCAEMHRREDLAVARKVERAIRSQVEEQREAALLNKLEEEL
jgi:hypothetical protein